MVFSKKNSNSIVIFLITAVCLVFTMNLSYIDITIMEARNFVTAREMILENNWLMPTFNGEPRYQKPPLPTWITALSSFMFGFKSLYFYRLPGFLVLAITGITSYYFSLELLNNKRDSIINAIITVTSFYIIAIVIEAPWDIYSHTFMFIAIYYLFRSLNSEVFKLKTAFLASIFIGCSFLSKGPISIYVLLIPFLISYFITYPSSVVKKIKKITPILITGLVIGAAWYLFLLIEDPTNLINTTKKETSNWSSYNIRPFYYYWSFFIQSGVWAIFAVLSIFYPYYKNKIKEYKKYKLTFLWTIIGVILLSIVPEKKPRYLMPILIPLALNIGFIFRYIKECYEKKKSSGKVLLFHYLLIIIIGFSFIFIKGFVLNLNINALDVILVILSLLIMVRLLNLNDLKFININTVSLLILIFSISNSPTLMENKNKLYRSVNELNNSKTQIFTNYNLSPEIIWDFGKKIENIDNKKIKEITENKLKFGLLTNKPLLIKDTVLNDVSYKIKLVTKYDLNNLNNKKRLITYYHLFSPE